MRLMSLALKVSLSESFPVLVFTGETDGDGGNDERGDEDRCAVERDAAMTGTSGDGDVGAIGIGEALSRARFCECVSATLLRELLSSAVQYSFEVSVFRKLVNKT